MSDVAIQLQDVRKVFTPQQHLHTSLKEALFSPIHVLRRARAARFLALDDVSLVVERGETHGIVGRNGAGKSTLLGIIGGVLRPTAGQVQVVGRVSPLLELGVGFVPDLSGDENAVLNGVLLGLRRREIEERLDDVIQFAELEAFRRQELKTYSSGMQSRLGFSVAVHADPEVLLVDEVLAVGDAAFQERCLDRIAALRGAGATILFVSHDLKTTSRICDRVTWLDQGRVRATGPAAEVADQYLESVGSQGTSLLDRLARPAGEG
ncbi:MAG: ABC transporter ATP-binding protein [Proteobacteria bacterium]|nr:ABC transporter ATP-binding protein [Pseudomonadota bacterium]